MKKIAEVNFQNGLRAREKLTLYYLQEGPGQSWVFGSSQFKYKRFRACLSGSGWSAWRIFLNRRL